MRDKDDLNLNILELIKLYNMNQLIREKKIEFGFYDNKLIKLELLQICYDKSKDRLEIEFRDVIGDYLSELKEATDEIKS